MTLITFYDAAEAINIETERYVALYGADTDHPCPPEIANRFDGAHKRWITFAGNDTCSIIDFEKYTRDFADPAILRNWLRNRLEDKDTREAWIYSDLSNAPLAAHWARGLPFQWWIATLDGVRRTQQQLSDLMIAWGTPSQYAHPYLIGANQWRNEITRDQSVAFGRF